MATIPKTIINQSANKINMEMEMENFNSDFQFEGNTFKLENHYKLIKLGNTDIYEIRTKKNITFKVDKEFIAKLFIHKANNTINVLEWELEPRSKSKINTIINDVKINIVNYLTDNADIDIKYKFINDDTLDFRISNIEIIKKHNKKLAPKAKKVDSPKPFYKEDDIKILKEFEGIKSTAGKYSGIIFNNYRLVEILTEKDKNKNKYYEIFVGYDEPNEDATELELELKKSTLYSFIIDIDDLDKIRNVEITNKFNKKEIIHPIWHMSTNQYIWTKIENKTVYLHRFLMNIASCSTETVDHINNNKFDNRKANLRKTTQSVQNMNQTNKEHKISLNSILNPNNEPSIPKLTNDKLIFIHPEKHTDSKNNIIDIFRIEISSARTKSIPVQDHSTKQNKTGLTVHHRLAHAIVKRYYYVEKYHNIISEMVDNTRFSNLAEFKTYTETLITEIFNKPTTIDAFLDYMLSLKLPKYTDPRSSIVSVSNVSNISDRSIENVSTIKFDCLNYVSSRNKFDITIIIGKDANSKHIKYTNSGCGGDNLSLEDKKAFALVIRYNTFVEIENDLNKQIHTTPPITDINLNTTGLKSLTDFTLEGGQQTMKNFIELRTHTEKYINKLLNSDTPYTLETFAEFITKKANHKKINLQVVKLAYDYPPLVKP